MEDSETDRYSGDGSEEDDDDFIARDYQSQLCEQALNTNTILFLPTGSGKTYIAVMVIKLKFAELEKPFLEGGKRSIFLVNTVALVDQQALVLERHLRLDEVGRYSGDMNIDFWEKKTWHHEFIRYKVMVMTCEIFNQLLHKGHIKLQQISVLVFDECHHAVNDHPFRQIMMRFEDTPKEQHPRIIGLTATLLNGNPKLAKVDDEVRKLEVTLRSKVATVDSYSVVESFSTKPKEQFLYFKKNVATPCYTKCSGIIEKALILSDTWDYDSNERREVTHLPGFFPVFNSSKKGPVRNTINNVMKQLDNLGVYGASKAALAVITQLQQMKQQSEDRNSHLMLCSLISHLISVRKILACEMGNHVELIHPVMYSSPKVRKLLLVLRDHYNKCMAMPESKRENMMALVFAQERMTVKVLCSVLLNASKLDEFSFIKPVFMVGGSCNPLSETWEGAFLKRQNDDAIQRFRNGEVNIMVCSDVLEEGVDIPLCNLVVKFDRVLTFRSYIQSKGRARHKTSSFILMVEEGEEQQKNWKNIATFNEVERRLKQLLVGSTDDRLLPSSKEISLAIQESLEPYHTPVAVLSMTSAIQTVNSYCMSLSHDKFSKVSPLWLAKKVKGHWSALQAKTQICIQLPHVAPVKLQVLGLPMDNPKLAKRAAAFELAKQLHQLHELDDHLFPNKLRLTPEDETYLFPLYDSTEKSEGGIPGTQNKRRTYAMTVASCFTHCKPEPGVDVYVHVIRMKPAEFTCPSDNRRRALHQVLETSPCYAILSSKKMSRVTRYPIYWKLGKIVVDVIPNASKLHFTASELSKIHSFHCMLFMKVVPVTKAFMSFSLLNQNRSYLIAPLKPGSMNNIELDWDVISMDIPKVEEPSELWRKSLDIARIKDLNQCIVCPWYRGLAAAEVYLVTGVAASNSYSSFKTKEGSTSYIDYFKKKHKVTVLSPNLPVLQVKSFKLLSNALLPCNASQSSEYVGEYFPPEMCTCLEYPAGLWLQATFLPSALHRLERLCVSEDLRRTIAEETGCGMPHLPLGMEWQELEAESAVPVPVLVPEEGQPQCVFRKQTLKRNTEVGSGLKPWGCIKEPVDLERNFENVTEDDVTEYVKFISKKVSLKSSPFTATNKVVQKRIQGHSMQEPGQGCLKVLTACSPSGPEQAKLYQALTAASANDIVNLERLETLGDSFLKLAASVFLFTRFPSHTEGNLTSIKGKLIGNRNLFYCGQAKNLGNRLKGLNVDPQVHWMTPCFNIPAEISSSLDEGLFSGMMRKLLLSEEEQVTGNICRETFTKFHDDVRELSEDLKRAYTKKSTHNDVFLGKSTIPDKTVSDCVEALIGTYLESNGVRGALQILGWLQILPEEIKKGNEITHLTSLLNDVKHSPTRRAASSHNIDRHLEGYKYLEETLGYKFRNRGFLLEALTHPSYSANDITSSYERLEFIGDAILDFLVTAFIYENCGKLDPGQLTDLRSALVNNVTFACLSVRNGFHKFMLSGHPMLLESMDRFVQFQRVRNHIVDDEVLIMLEESDARIAETVEVPKALGDLFESLAGAIFLDSGSLSTVWRVFYPLMRKEIETFSSNVPKQLVRRLYEMVGVSSRIQFRSKTLPPPQQEVVVVVTVTIGTEEKHFHGFGENKKKAKKSAAKLALRELQPIYKIQ